MILLLILAAAGTPVVQDAAVNRQNVFDFTFVESALTYLATGDEAILADIADGPAAEHLAAHATRVSMDGRVRSPQEIVNSLLKPRVGDNRTPDSVQRLVAMVRQDAARRNECLAGALAYLPDGSPIRGKLFLTYGYDIGVAVSGNASLNLAHEHFLRNPEEVWYYCVHELHHAGFQTFHDLPKISTLETVQDLIGLIEYSTQLEGMAVHAARRPRAEHEALESDEDYVTLQDDRRMAAYEREYFEILQELIPRRTRPLTDSDWAVLDRMSDGDRLWYRVGALMADRIEAAHGRSRLRSLVASGPQAFLDAYRALETEK